MLYEQSRSFGIVACTVLGSLSVVGMVVVTVAGRDIPPALATVSGVALGIIGTLVNTYTPQRQREIPPK